MADVYVPRQVEVRSGRAPEPAERLFTVHSRARVLLAGAGDGKSTLLRRHLTDAAAHLSRHASEGTPVTAPVLVRATELVASPLLADALATAVTRAFGPFGLREALAGDFFRRRPYPDASWLVMVDGLDEVSDRAARLSLLDRLCRETGQKDSPYRFLIATRPLPVGELERLGRDADHFTLSPFTDDDLRAYVQKRFSGLADADRHVRAFTNGVIRTRLEGLARTPLMAAMLCRLYVSDPDQPLPDGRTGVFRSFTELLYEQNAHKGVAALQEQAIHALTSRYQLPGDRRAVEQAAERAREHLPRLIDHLAHERLDGSTAPAGEILAAHPHARRPEKVTPPLWRALLTDLLRATGLLADQADDVDFVHRTLLEYHAARHATRDEQARDRLLRTLFPARRLRDRFAWPGRRAPDGDRRHPLDLDPSHLGFLLDGLLVPGDRIAAATVRALEDLLTPAGMAGYYLLKAQVQLGSALPPQTTARWLSAFARSPLLIHRHRVEAAWDLAELDGHREEGATLLARLARGRDLEPFERGWAAAALAGLDGHREEGARLLLELAQYGDALAARSLARLGGRHGEDGAGLLAAFAADPDTEPHARVWAAQYLAEVDGCRQQAVRLLTAFAHESAPDSYARMVAAEGLAAFDEEKAAELLLHGLVFGGFRASDRVRALKVLACSTVHRGVAAEPLAAFAADPTADATHRVDAAEELASLDGHREEGIALLTRIAEDTGVDDWDRMLAAASLAALGEERSAPLLAAFAADTALQSDARVQAARALAELDGHRARGIMFLAAFADDTTRHRHLRSNASASLTTLGRYRIRR
ncbi:NACHT domain-containing protein [Streptosporangium canum]|uniref:NACHT domain-containing protein n=1 Tax=Streptosporangium canum TaxID=324952 RepID=UPI0037A20485